MRSLLPVEAACVVVNAQHGIEPVTERVWKYAEEANIPRFVVINQMDHPKAGGGGGLSALIDDLHERWGRNCVPVQLPISDAQGFHGVVDLVTMEAFHYTPNGDGRGKITGEIPASIAQQAKEAHEALVELVAEGKDELMEEFFAEGTIPEQHLITALHEAIREDRIFPGSVFERRHQRGHRPSAGLHQGVCAVADGARADSSKDRGDAGCGNAMEPAPKPVPASRSARSTTASLRRWWYSRR